MEIAFYLSAAIAILATLRVITCTNAIHALLYMITSLLAAGVVFFTFGAPFAAAIVVIVNAGAIMVLFVFVIMMLNLGPHATEQEKTWLSPGIWVGPTILALILVIELAYSLLIRGTQAFGPHSVQANQVGVALFGPYMLAVELASMLLLAGLLGAYHLGRGVTHREDKRL
jgi:NADH-quinone oxidoreductase subunit J